MKKFIRIWFIISLVILIGHPLLLYGSAFLIKSFNITLPSTINTLMILFLGLFYIGGGIFIILSPIVGVVGLMRGWWVYKKYRHREELIHSMGIAAVVAIYFLLVEYAGMYIPA